MDQKSLDEIMNPKILIRIIGEKTEKGQGIIWIFDHPGQSPCFLYVASVF